MNGINCTLYCYSNSPHLQQIYTGFSLLQRQGAIRLSFHILKHKPKEFSGMGPNTLRVVLDDRVLMYDTFDGNRIDPRTLQNVDFYFKRSYSQSSIPSDHVRKVFPLGLYYYVHEDSPSFFWLQRLRLDKQMKRRISNALASLAIDRFVGGKWFYVPRVTNCFDYPRLKLEPRALFMTHLWDPSANSIKSERLGQSRESIEQINEMRVACIRALRKEFGERFFGGVAFSEYSTKNYRDSLLPAPQLSRRGNYMEILRHYPICITTTGLFGSIGGKFAEYVCFSKAIVSERLNYVAPGLGGAEANYLEFSTPDECVAAVTRLFEDHALRHRLMVNNFHYYHAYLRPDSLVMNTLMIALSGEGNEL